MRACMHALIRSHMFNGSFEIFNCRFVALRYLWRITFSVYLLINFIVGVACEWRLTRPISA